MTTYGPNCLDEDFGSGLDAARWLPAYLPAWSSRAAARACWSTGPAGLTLTVPADHPIWCAADHRPLLRVSAVQSGNWSGPAGSVQGQQPFRPGQPVLEAQPPMWGLTPRYGHIAVTCHAEVAAGSMFAAWLIGLEDQPEHCGEICLVEVFGSTVEQGSAAVGRGVHRFRDPRLREDFAAPTCEIDVARPHTYAVDWSPAGVDFLVDGRLTHTSTQSPDYPMQLMIAVFDFPLQCAAAGIAADFVPTLQVNRVQARPM